MVFGWGKPVNVMLADPQTRAKIDILSTMGGVSMNLVIALVSAILLAIFEVLAMPDFSQIALTSIFLNCVLFVINMIPVPPLDGSVFLKYCTTLFRVPELKIKIFIITLLILLFL